LNWRLKLSNWLSGGALERYQRQEEMAQAKLKQNEIILNNLRSQLQQSQTDIERFQAQLKIYKGFQVELGETQIKLQSAKTQVESYQQELIFAQERLTLLESKYQQAEAELSNSKNWLKQVQKPIEVVAITKLLPKEEFDALWGFGLGSPKANSTLIGGSITIKGWVLGRRANVSKVQVTCQKQVLVEAEIGLARPAITQQYPDISGAGNSGFECSLAVIGIPSETELAISATLEDKSLIPLCAITLKESNQNLE
jgi:multidrug efflux pump subunit AcrA (membrane-fusion protein)